MGLPGLRLSNCRLFFFSLKGVIVVKFQSSCRFSDHLANPKNLLATVRETRMGSRSPPRFHPSLPKGSGTPGCGGDILKLHADYFRVPGPLVPRKQVPKFLFSALGSPWALNPSQRPRPSPSHGETGCGSQESRVCWGLPFRRECPVHGTVGRTSCFEGQVST